MKYMSSNARIKDRLLYKLFSSSWLPYVNPSSRTQAVMKSHTQVGHGAFKKTTEWLKFHCYWEGMTNTIQKVLDACLV